MTTYFEDDASVESSQPRELYTFTIDEVVRRYTTHHSSVTYDGNVFEPLPGLERDEVAAVTTSGIGSYEMTVTMPRRDFVVASVAKTELKPLLTTCLIQRLQVVSGIAIRIWEGPVMGVNRGGLTAKLRIATRFDSLEESSATRVKVQRACNWSLYDSRCGVSRGDFGVSRNTTITDVKSNRKFSVDNAYATGTAEGKPSSYIGGEVLVGGRRLTIVDVDGLDITVLQPFPVATGYIAPGDPSPAVQNGDAVTLYLGCSRSFDVCNLVFENTANFGGFKDLPTESETGFFSWIRSFAT